MIVGYAWGIDTLSMPALIGPRHFGGSTLALGIAENRAAIYLDPERVADQQCWKNSIFILMHR